MMPPKRRKANRVMPEAALLPPKPRAHRKKGESRAAESIFFGMPLPNFKAEGLSGHLIVLEGIDGSGRSTQIALLQEWLESEGFAVTTMGLRRSSLLAKNIDEISSRNVVTRLTLALLYATDFFDQLEHMIIPALHAGGIVLADRYVFTLIARAAVRGIKHSYLWRIYQMAIRPDFTFFLDVNPQVAFDRELKKAQGINYWESGRDMHLSSDLFDSFMRYQTIIRREFEYLSKRHDFIHLDGQTPIRAINDELRKHIASRLGIDNIRFRPSPALIHLWH